MGGMNPVAANNIATAASFYVNPAGANYHLVSGGAPINAGVDLTATVPTDIEGISRSSYSAPDLGAYEYAGVSAPTNRAPIVNAGPDFTITLPNGITLAGSATDDGLALLLVADRHGHVRQRGGPEFHCELLCRRYIHITAHRQRRIALCFR